MARPLTVHKAKYTERMPQGITSDESPALSAQSSAAQPAMKGTDPRRGARKLAAHPTAHDIHQLKPMRTTLFTILAACLCLLLPSCLAGSHTTSNHTGKYVSPDTLAQVKPGEQRATVEAMLGAPSSRVDLADGSQVWKWAYKIDSTSHGRVFLLFNTNDETTKEGAAYVEFDPNGTVVKTWRD